MAIPIDASWTLTFDEEFNGNLINTKVWGTNWLGNDGAITKPVNSEELAAYDPARVSVSGGYLHLDAIASKVTVGGTTYDYRSGLVNTHDSFSQTYGYFEARMYLPGKNGEIDNWPAFWLDGENWPYDGELDVMEGLGGEAAYHFHSPSGGPGKSVKGDYTGWHVFGALWEPGKVSFYYDNQYVGQITDGITSSPQYIILNLGIGIHSIVSVPSEILVDWVHVYSSNSKAIAVNPQANYTGPGGTELINVVMGTPVSDDLSGTSNTDHIIGRAGDDTLIGGMGDDKLAGGAGNDILRGNQGNDILVGAGGIDTLTGGGGADTFVFRWITDSPATGGSYTTITDFQRTAGDEIALNALDADTGRDGNQAFTFIGSSGFSGHAGELRYVAQTDGLLVRGDVDGDGKADFTIAVLGLDFMKVTDFIL